MRAIDNYTDKQLNELDVKGMTAPRTASERAQARVDEAYAISYNVDRGDGSKLAALLDERDKLKAHADKLAGALRNALNMIDPFVWDKSKEAAILAAYEESKQ